MSWIKVFDRGELPRKKGGYKYTEPSIFLAIYKGTIALVEYDEDEDRFYMISWPARTGSWRLTDQEDEKRFTFWMPLPELPACCQTSEPCSPAAECPVCRPE